MIGKPGPFRIIRSEPHETSLAPQPPPRRRYHCQHYSVCLNLAAALDWDNFTCRGCSGEVDENLLWRAYQEARKDEVASKVCSLPQVEVHQTEDSSDAGSNEPPLKRAKAG